jgi:hypothetical protein
MMTGLLLKFVVGRDGGCGAVIKTSLGLSVFSLFFFRNKQGLDMRR